MNRSRRRRRPGGFTLIEVLLVLVILVILASLGTFSVLNAQKKANIDAAKSQIGLLKTPIQEFMLDENRFPASLDELVNPPATGKAVGSYLDNGVLPLDPWGNRYQYQSPGAHNPQSYDLWTISPDGAEIGNWEAMR
jgi:general secretion pathway protein G